MTSCHYQGPAVMLLVLCLFPVQAGEPVHSEVVRPDISEHYVMLYYRDIAAARQFYGETMRLQATFEDSWVTLYRLTPSSFIGIVQEGGSAYHHARDDNAVMVSIVTNDVEAWYRRLTQESSVKVLRKLYDHDSVPIRAFLIEDPGGYTIEFFQWLNR